MQIQLWIGDCNVFLFQRLPDQFVQIGPSFACATDIVEPEMPNPVVPQFAEQRRLLLQRSLLGVVRVGADGKDQR